MSCYASFGDILNPHPASSSRPRLALSSLSFHPTAGTLPTSASPVHSSSQLLSLPLIYGSFHFHVLICRPQRPWLQQVRYEGARIYIYISISIYLSIFLSIHRYIYLPTYLFIYHLHTYLSMCIYLSIYTRTYFCMYLSIYLYVYPCIHLST